VCQQNNDDDHDYASNPSPHVQDAIIGKKIYVSTMTEPHHPRPHFQSRNGEDAVHL
jgi:hypothetical protein